MARTRILITCATLVAPLALAIPAEAAGKTGLVLAVHDDFGRLNTTRLRCEPTGGTHTNATDACDDLIAANGDFSKLPGDPDVQFCTLEFQPVKATARGVWRGKPVSWRSESYPNRCAMNAALGPVFRFD